MTTNNGNNFFSLVGETMKTVAKIFELTGETIKQTGKNESNQSNDKNSSLFASVKNLIKNNVYIEELTYEDVVRYFVKERPSDSRIKKGAILRENHPEGQLVIQVFLDEKNELICTPSGEPYGRKLIIRKFDDELTEAFQDKTLIIFE